MQLMKNTKKITKKLYSTLSHKQLSAKIIDLLFHW